VTKIGAPSSVASAITTSAGTSIPAGSGATPCSSATMPNASSAAAVRPAAQDAARQARRSATTPKPIGSGSCAIQAGMR
jgi:hypothetical protein